MKDVEFDDPILIVGGSGMVGSALIRRMEKEGYKNLLTPTHKELDCTEQEAVRAYMQAHRPRLVFVAAARVGGIHANASYGAEFLYENLMIECNLIHQAHQAGVSRLLLLGSSCIYPKMAPQPIVEESLLTGPLEKTNEPYAIAKIAGVKLCETYTQRYGRKYYAVMPANLYGPGDNYHPENSHAVAALLRRFHEAVEKKQKVVTVWGTGRVQREFLFVDDLADACLFILQNMTEPRLVNVGSEDEVSIQQLAHMIAILVGYEGKILNDISKPDGTPRKKCDTSRLESLGWKAQTPLVEGLRMMYDDFLAKQSSAVLREV